MTYTVITNHQSRPNPYWDVQIRGIGSSDFGNIAYARHHFGSAEQVTGINPDWDTITIWMCREPIQIHEFVQEATNDKQLSRLGQIPYLDVTHICPLILIRELQPRFSQRPYRAFLQGVPIPTPRSAIPERYCSSRTSE
jgi:hypothetical protein